MVWELWIYARKAPKTASVPLWPPQTIHQAILLLKSSTPSQICTIETSWVLLIDCMKVFKWRTPGWYFSRHPCRFYNRGGLELKKKKKTVAAIFWFRNDELGDNWSEKHQRLEPSLSFQASAPISILYRPGFNNKLPIWMDFKKLFRFPPTKKNILLAICGRYMTFPNIIIWKK